MFSKTVTLVAETNTEFDFNSESFDAFVIYNFGDTAVYVNVDEVAEVEGDGSVAVPASNFRTITHRGKTLNAISSGTPKIEVMGVRQ